MSLPRTEVQSSRAAGACDLPTLLIVGDPAGLNVAREVLIELELGWDVLFADSAFDAHDVPAIRTIDVILVDLGNPHIEGVELVESLAANFPHTPIVLMSAPYGVNVALEAMRKGAFEHFPRDLLDVEPAAVLDVLRAAAREHQRQRIALARLDNLFFEMSLTNDRAEAPAIARRLTDAVIETGLCDRAAATRVGVALEESLLNAIIHGNLEVSSDLRQVDESAYDRQIEERRTQLPYRDRRVKLTARVSSHEAVFVVQDEGPGFDIAAVPDPTDPENLCRVGGRGILLMRSFMSSVHFGERGNIVTLVKRKPR